MIFVLLTYGGWNEAAYISGEVRNARRNIAWSLLWGISLIATILILANLAYLKGLGLTAMSGSEVVVADVMRHLAGEGGATFVSALIAIAALGSMNATTFTGARSIYALAEATQTAGTWVMSRPGHRRSLGGRVCPDVDARCAIRPAPPNVVAEMLRLTGVTKDDVVYDLGCGDGRLVVTAAERFGARGVGIDIDPQRIRKGRANARKAGVDSIGGMDSRRHRMTWDLVIFTVVALLVLLLVAGRSRRPRRVPQGYETRPTRRTTYEMGYTNGFRVGYRAGQVEPRLPPGLRQHMLVLVHPDRHEGSPPHPMAAEVTR
jgi:Amino acid permease/Methyltransferase domain